MPHNGNASPERMWYNTLRGIKPTRKKVIIVLSRERNRQEKSTERLNFYGHRRCWETEFADRDSEEGDLLCAVGEYAGTGWRGQRMTDDGLFKSAEMWTRKRIVTKEKTHELK